MSKVVDCPICKTSNSEKTKEDSEEIYINCPRCGHMKFIISFYISIPTIIERINKIHPKNNYLVSHVIRKHYNSESEFVHINNDFINNAITTFELPNIIEQANNLILFIGDKSFFYSDILKISGEFCLAMIGSCSEDDYMVIQKHLRDSEYISIPEQYDNLDDFFEPSSELGLTFAGWEKYNELTNYIDESKYAFMAMDYNDKLLNKICDNHFKKAVAETGFELILLRDRPKAGIIDNYLRVSIKRAKFLIADLTHENNGAYWEAGYAEGLGKHVIYLCKKGIKSHFDTNHCTTIFWEEDKIKEACEELKSTIRNTFYSEAKQED